MALIILKNFGNYRINQIFKKIKIKKEIKKLILKKQLKIKLVFQRIIL